jgi:hypothetical protein
MLAVIGMTVTLVAMAVTIIGGHVVLGEDLLEVVPRSDGVFS